eukprot:CAMPEP_0196722596 /NCGR_PEP_ID=MMETSP1091-20130531/4929_1 /TAXON_ID=302021 /ORGANISM="Rhodomonas sp., Strain CCMP768" /LENGTH=80 /DNA_ID=CAMNT_0042064339 /DNA_START=593 /DNA_END=831 /DNA_ORIENTATION=+
MSISPRTPSDTRRKLAAAVSQTLPRPRPSSTRTNLSAQVTCACSRKLQNDSYNVEEGRQGSKTTLAVPPCTMLPPRREAA